MESKQPKSCPTCNKYEWSRGGKETVNGKCVTCAKTILKRPLLCDVYDYNGLCPTCAKPENNANGVRNFNETVDGECITCLKMLHESDE